MKSSVFIATSLDGYIARLDGALDWLPANGGEPHGYNEFMATVDAMVIGRKTFETVLAFESWPYGATPVFVLTSRPDSLNAPADSACQFLAGAPAEVVDYLERLGFRHAYVDGGVTISRFLEAQLIDRMVVTRIPVVLGSGIPLFGQLARDIRFDHVATRAYASGMVQSEYRVITSDSQ